MKKMIGTALISMTLVSCAKPPLSQEKTAAEHAVVQEKETSPTLAFSVRLEGTTVYVKHFEGSLSELADVVDMSVAQRIEFSRCRFSAESRSDRLASSPVSVLIFTDCTFFDLGFLEDFPALQAVYAPHAATHFPADYELDLSRCQQLRFIDMFHMNFNITFKQIKDLPASLVVCSFPDARFDLTNLPELQQRYPNVSFFLPVDEAAWTRKGVQFTSFADFQAAEQKYHLGMK